MAKEITTQAENKVSIIGKLLNVNIRKGKARETGVDYASVTYEVRVRQSYEGHEEVSDVMVENTANMLIQKGPKAGQVNPAYENIVNMEKFATAKNAGIDAADTVVITRGELVDNTYVSKQSGKVIPQRRVRASFCARANNPEAEDIASFRADIFIMSMTDEVDSEGAETGRLLIKGGLVGYGGRLGVLEFVVEDPGKVDFIRRTYEENQTGSFVGRIRDCVKNVVAKKTTGSWGEDIPDNAPTAIHELIITGGAEMPYEEDFAYDPTDIRKAFNVRKAMLEQKLEESRARAEASKKQAKPTSGWADDNF